MILAGCLLGAGWSLGQALWLQAKALLAQQLMAAAWAGTLEKRAPVRPWPWADTWPVARLTIPGGGHLFVLHGVHGQSLAFGPGHLPGSALPGDGGTVVLAGHRDSHFAFVKSLEPGDVLRLQSNDGAERGYRVVRTAVVDSRIARIDPAGGDEQLVLITCYPFHTLSPGGPLRYVVTARPEGGDGGVDSADRG